MSSRGDQIWDTNRINSNRTDRKLIICGHLEKKGVCKCLIKAIILPYIIFALSGKRCFAITPRNLTLRNLTPRSVTTRHCNRPAACLCLVLMLHNLTETGENVLTVHHVLHVTRQPLLQGGGGGHCRTAALQHGLVCHGPPVLRHTHPPVSAQSHSERQNDIKSSPRLRKIFLNQKLKYFLEDTNLPSQVWPTNPSLHLTSHKLASICSADTSVARNDVEESQRR